MSIVSGIRCFMLNLFVGPLRENQDLIVQLREAEICVAKEYGFPVASTIFAKMSPRYQFTGYLSGSEDRIMDDSGLLAMCAILVLVEKVIRSILTLLIA